MRWEGGMKIPKFVLRKLWTTLTNRNKKFSLDLGGVETGSMYVQYVQGI